MPLGALIHWFWFLCYIKVSQEHSLLYTDRHHSLTSGNIPKTEGSQIHLIFVTAICCPWNSTDTKIGFVWANEFYRKHALAYPHHSFKTCGGPKAFTSTTMLKKCGGKLARDGRSATSRNPIKRSAIVLMNSHRNTQAYKTCTGINVIGHASVEHHGVQPTGCMDNEPEPSCGVPC